MAVRFVALLIPLALTLPQLRNHLAEPAPAQPSTSVVSESAAEWSAASGRHLPAQFTPVVLEPASHLAAMPVSMPASMPASMPVSMSGAMPVSMPGAMAGAMTGAMAVAMPGAMAVAMPAAMPAAMPGFEPPAAAAIGCQAHAAAENKAVAVPPVRHAGATHERGASKALRRNGPRVAAAAAVKPPQPKPQLARKARPALEAGCAPQAHCAPVSVAKITPVQRRAL
jgi:hypothetical protein